MLFAADRETLAPLGTTAFQDEPAILGGHTDQESVGLFPMPVIRLKRAFSLGHRVSRGANASFLWTLRLRAMNRTVNGSERLERVSIGTTLCYSLRPSQHVKIPVELMRFWSGPRVFHTCGKNCGKSQVFGNRIDFSHVCRDFLTGETPEPRQIAALRALIRSDPDK